MKKNKKKRSFTLILRNYFITGVVVLIPIGFTLYLSKILIGVSSNLIPENIILIVIYLMRFQVLKY
jgi:uncharacterized membrane protein